MKTVLLTGGTGLIGREVGKHLVRAGFQVTVLSRSREKALETLPFPAQVIEGDLAHAPLKDRFSFDVVVHLAGENIAEGRWTEERKKQLRQSRIEATQNLVQSVTTKVFVSTSAVGYYGNRDDETLTETSSPGTDFLAQLCQDWERAAHSFPDSVRTTVLRFGLVVAPFGGAMGKLIPLFKTGLGGRLGSGDQWMSWIHIEDLVRLILESATNEKYRGVINAVSPDPVKNSEWTEMLAKELGVIKGPPVPGVALKVAVGELSDSLLGSSKVMPVRAQELGFQFRYAKLQQTFHDVCGYFRDGETFRAEQYLPGTPAEVFKFFADAKNLELITPKFLNFHIVQMSTAKIEQGTLIDYKLKLRGLPISWQTRIEDWDPPRRFVDTQVKGPYNLWHHTHLFETLGPGTLMTDLVKYRLPMGVLGRLAAGAFVASDVEKIFDYRRNAVRQLSLR